MNKSLRIISVLLLLICVVSFGVCVWYWGVPGAERLIRMSEYVGFVAGALGVNGLLWTAEL